MEVVTLKIGGSTDYISAASSITKHILNDNKVYVDVIGAAANYICTKSFIKVKTSLSTKGILVVFSPTFVEFNTGKNTNKTGVRWRVIAKRK